MGATGAPRLQAFSDGFGGRGSGATRPPARPSSSREATGPGWSDHHDQRQAGARAAAQQEAAAHVQAPQPELQAQAGPWTVRAASIRLPTFDARTDATSPAPAQQSAASLVAGAAT
jgi:hypothetical protein